MLIKSNSIVKGSSYLLAVDHKWKDCHAVFFFFLGFVKYPLYGLSSEIFLLKVLVLSDLTRTPDLFCLTTLNTELKHFVESVSQNFSL